MKPQWQPIAQISPAQPALSLSLASLVFSLCSNVIGLSLTSLNQAKERAFK
jgi:hypothetical protein